MCWQYAPAGAAAMRLHRLAVLLGLPRGRHGDPPGCCAARVGLFAPPSLQLGSRISGGHPCAAPAAPQDHPSCAAAAQPGAAESARAAPPSLQGSAVCSRQCSGMSLPSMWMSPMWKRKRQTVLRHVSALHGDESNVDQCGSVCKVSTAQRGSVQHA